MKMLPTNTKHRTLHRFALTLALVDFLSTIILPPGAKSITPDGSREPIRNDRDPICSDSVDFDADLQQVVIVRESFCRTSGR